MTSQVLMFRTAELVPGVAVLPKIGQLSRLLVLYLLVIGTSSTRARRKMQSG